jgi:hypothetical protein
MEQNYIGIQNKKEKELKEQIGGVCFLLGFSIISSLIFTYYLELNLDKFLLFMEQVNKITLYFLVFALFMIIEGIAFYKDAFLYPNIRFKRNGKPIKMWVINLIKDLVKDFFHFSLIIFSYTVLFTIGLFYFYMPEKIAILIKHHPHYVISINVIIIFILFYEIKRVFSSLIEILKRNVVDSKDRLTLAITILTTIISAIALFK